MRLEELGTRIRHFFRGLLGSRLNAHLEVELMQLRADYEIRLQERERTISDLREQAAELKSKVDRYELVLIPLMSPIGQAFAPKKERPPLEFVEPAQKSWPEIQRDWDRQQEAEAAAAKTAPKQ